MLVHHHIDTRRTLRIVIAIWILLLILLLLPVRTHAQQYDAPPVNAVEGSADSPVAPELLEIMAFEIAILWCVMLSYLIFSARRHRAPTPKRLPHPLH